MTDRFVFTSESVTEGHPDKLCDQISDAVVDAFLAAEPASRVIAECAVAKGILFVAVRFTSTAAVDVPSVAREVIRRVGYTHGGFDARSCSILTSINEAPEPYEPIDERALDEAGLDAVTAKHQCTLFGYACRQSPALMPLPVWLAHKLARRLAEAGRGELDHLAPDGQAQVAVVFEDGRPRRLDAVTLVASTLPDREPSLGGLRDDLMQAVIGPALEDEPVGLDRDTRVNINPEGLVPIGGPELHAGLTGRKTAIDTYGEFSRNSSAALSGKDPSRIDRVGAYAARHAAKAVVAAGLAEQCEVQLSYSLGLSQPVSLRVDTDGTGTRPDEELGRALRRSLDFRPAGIVARFGLRHLPDARGGRLYERLAAYGQMGRTDLEPPWEDVAEAAEALAE